MVPCALIVNVQLLVIGFFVIAMVLFDSDVAHSLFRLLSIISVFVGILML